MTNTAIIHQRPSMELNKDGSVHGVIKYWWGESPGCSTYCKEHVDYILRLGCDIIPRHDAEKCSGFECYHGSGMTVTVKEKSEE